MVRTEFGPALRNAELVSHPEFSCSNWSVLSDRSGFDDCAVIRICVAVIRILCPNCPDKLASTPGKRSFWRKRGVPDPAADAEGGAGCVRSEEEGEGEGEREEEDVWAVRRSPLAARSRTAVDLATSKALLMTAIPYCVELEWRATCPRCAEQHTSGSQIECGGVRITEEEFVIKRQVRQALGQRRARTPPVTKAGPGFC